MAAGALAACLSTALGQAGSLPKAPLRVATFAQAERTAWAALRLERHYGPALGKPSPGLGLPGGAFTDSASFTTQWRAQQALLAQALRAAIPGNQQEMILFAEVFISTRGHAEHLLYSPMCSKMGNTITPGQQAALSAGLTRYIQSPTPTWPTAGRAYYHYMQIMIAGKI